MATSAVLQLNDPDPALWVAAYGAATMAFGAGAIGRANNWLTGVTMLFLILLAARSAPGFFEWLTEHRGESITGEMSADKAYIEETREFLGLVIALGGLGAMLCWPPRRPSGGSGDRDHHRG